jgi:hypothetical protein
MLTVFVALVNLDQRAFVKPPGVFRPRLVAGLPVGEYSIAEEADDVISDALIEEARLAQLFGSLRLGGGTADVRSQAGVVRSLIGILSLIGDDGRLDDSIPPLGDDPHGGLVIDNLIDGHP